MCQPRADLPAWRSLLFVPVVREAFVAGAHRRGADGIILDLEDSVPRARRTERECYCLRPRARPARAVPTSSCASTAPGIARFAISRRRSTRRSPP